MSSASDPDLTRKQRREQARTERKAVEEAEAASAKRRTRLLQLGILAAVVAKAQDPAKVDPRHYKVLLNKEYVRILDVRQQPGDKSPMHSHPHGLVYVLAGGKIRSTSAAGVVSESESKAGDLMWREGLSHSLENVGSSEVHSLSIELKPCASDPAAR